MRSAVRSLALLDYDRKTVFLTLCKHKPAGDSTGPDTFRTRPLPDRIERGNLAPLAVARPTEARTPKPIIHHPLSAARALCAAFVAVHDAPLIGQRAATRRRIATGGWR